MNAQTETQDAEVSTDGPLLDLTDAGVKKFIKQAKARGYVTMEELNKVLPSEEVTPDAIEDTLAMLSEMGVNVVEAEEDAQEQQSTDVAAAASTGGAAGFPGGGYGGEGHDALHGRLGDVVEHALEVVEEYGVGGAFEDEGELRRKVSTWQSQVQPSPSLLMLGEFGGGMDGLPSSTG